MDFSSSTLTYSIQLNARVLANNCYHNKDLREKAKHYFAKLYNTCLVFRDSSCISAFILTVAYSRVCHEYIPTLKLTVGSFVIFLQRKARAEKGGTNIMLTMR